MCASYSLNTIDVFAIGIGVGLAGALLVIRGILTGPDAVEVESTRAQRYGVIVNIRAAKDWADGGSGAVFITIGFLLQAIQIIYAIPPVQLFTQSRIEVMIMIIGGLLAGLLLANFIRWNQIKWYLIRRACYDKRDSTKHKLPSATELIACGVALDKAPHNAEEPSDYLKRVWNIDRSR
jgi:hypothetical protein